MSETISWLLESLDGSALRIADDVLTIEGSDGSDNKRVHLGRTRSAYVASAGQDDEAYVYLGFTDADIEIFGVRMGYTPFRVAIHPKRVDLAVRMVRYIRERYLAYRRRSECPIPSPAGLEVDVDELGGQQSSLESALTRIRDRQPDPVTVNALSQHLQQSESVIELMCAGRPDRTVLAAVTTRRLVVAWDEGGVAERPLTGVRWARPMRDSTELVIFDLVPDADIIISNSDPGDSVRFAAAVQRFLQLQGYVGSLDGGVPSVTELFSAWETTKQHVELGIVSEEQAGRELSGILYTTVM